MKNALATILSFFLFLNLVIAQNWNTIQLIDFASIDFPDRPEKNALSNQTVFMVTDSIGIYMVMVRPLKDEQKTLAATDLEKYYETFIEASLALSKGKLVSKKTVDVKGLKGMEYKVNVTNKDQVTNVRFAKILAINDYLICVNFWTDERVEKKAEELKNYFFISFSASANTDR